MTSKQDLKLPVASTCSHETLKPPCEEAQVRTGGDRDPADNWDMSGAIQDHPNS